MKDLERKLKELAEGLRERNDDMQPFPRVDFAFTNDLPTQFKHLKSKVEKLEKLVELSDIDKDEDRIALAKSITKTMYSAFTMMNIIQKNFVYYSKEIPMEYMEKRYYARTIDEEEREMLLEAWRANKAMEKLEVMKKKRLGVYEFEQDVEEYLRTTKSDNQEEVVKGIEKIIEKHNMQGKVDMEIINMGRKSSNKTTNGVH